MFELWITISFSRSKPSTWRSRQVKRRCHYTAKSWNLIVYLQFLSCSRQSLSCIWQSRRASFPKPWASFSTSEMPLPVLLGPPAHPLPSESSPLTSQIIIAREKCKVNINKIFNYSLLCYNVLIAFLTTQHHQNWLQTTVTWENKVVDKRAVIHFFPLKKYFKSWFLIVLSYFVVAKVSKNKNLRLNN